MCKTSIKFFISRFFIKISFFCSELADFFHSLPVALLKPNELIELNNRFYSKPYVIENWNQSKDGGLSPSEEQFIKNYGFKGSGVLVIGCGGGRESIVLAARGFQVKAIDSSLGMLDVAAKNIQAAQVKMSLVHLSLYEIDRVESSFDLVFLGINYGIIPTRKLRREVLVKIRKILKPNGTVYLSFMEDKPSKYARLRASFYKLIAYLVFGNRDLEVGDFILGTGEFYHYFDSIDTVIKEVELAGFLFDDLNKDENALFLKARS